MEGVIIIREEGAVVIRGDNSENFHTRGSALDNLRCITCLCSQIL